jgi:hypothetical protein
MRPSDRLPCPLAGCRQTQRSIDVISCFSTHPPLRSAAFTSVLATMGDRLLAGLDPCRCLLGPYRKADRKRSLGVRMNHFPRSVPLPSMSRLDTGVALSGTLAQTGRPYGLHLRSCCGKPRLPSHTPSRERPRLSKASVVLVQLPRLMVASNRLHRGLSLQSFIHPNAPAPAAPPLQHTAEP